MIKAALALLGGPEGLKNMINAGLTDAEPALIEELAPDKALVFQVVEVGEGKPRLAVCLQQIKQEGTEQKLSKPIKTMSLEGFISLIVDKIK